MGVKKLLNFVQQQNKQFLSIMQLYFFSFLTFFLIICLHVTQAKTVTKLANLAAKLAQQRSETF